MIGVTKKLEAREIGDMLRNICIQGLPKVTSQKTQFMIMKEK